jgi:hypothetical protein
MNTLEQTHDLCSCSLSIIQLILHLSSNFYELHSCFHLMNCSCYCCFLLILKFWHNSDCCLLWKCIFSVFVRLSVLYSHWSYLNWFEFLACSFCMLLVLLATQLSWSTPNQECSTLSYWKNKVTEGVYQFCVTENAVFISYHYFCDFLVHYILHDISVQNIWWRQVERY